MTNTKRNTILILSLIFWFLVGYFLTGCTYEVKEEGFYIYTPNDGDGPIYTVNAENIRVHRVPTDTGWAVLFADPKTGNAITLIEGIHNYTCRKVVE